MMLENKGVLCVLRVLCFCGYLATSGLWLGIFTQVCPDGSHADKAELRKEPRSLQTEATGGVASGRPVLMIIYVCVPDEPLTRGLHRRFQEGNMCSGACPVALLGSSQPAHNGHLPLACAGGELGGA